MKGAILALYRVRGPVYGVAAVILVGNLIVGSSLSSEGIRQVRAVMVLAAFIAFVTCVLLAFLENLSLYFFARWCGHSLIFQEGEWLSCWGLQKV